MANTTSDSPETDGMSSPSGEHQQPEQNGSPFKRRSVRIRLVIFLLAIAAAGTAWFIYYQLEGQYIESTDDAYLEADIVTVAPKVSGYVEAVLVADNEEVKAGQPLVRIDARDYRAQAAQAQAQIDVAKANADALRAQIHEQESSIAEVRAQVAAAQSNADFAANELQRYLPLAQSGAETAEQLAAKRNQASQAANQLAAQRAALTSAERRIAALQAQIRQAEAQGEAAAAQLTAADVNVDSTTVRASINGHIGDKAVRLGQFVQQGTRMMSVVPEHLYITANFKETQIGRMRIGQPVKIKIDALPDVPLNGHVESLGPGTGAQFSLLPPQNATGNFTKIVQRVPVRIALDAGPDARRILVAGLSVTVKVDTEQAKDDDNRIEAQEKARQESVR